MLVTKRKSGSANIPARWGAHLSADTGVKRLPKYTIPEIAAKYKIDEGALYQALFHWPNPPQPFVTKRGKLNYYEAKDIVLWYRKGEAHAQLVLRGGLQQQVG